MIKYDMFQGLIMMCGGNGVGKALWGPQWYISMSKTLSIMRLPFISSVQIPGYRGEGWQLLNP